MSSPPSSQSSLSSTFGYLEQFLAASGTLASYMKIPALATTGIAAALSSLLYLKQNALIYPSHVPADARTHVPNPTHFGITDWEDVTLHTPDGEKLAAFYIRAPNQSQRQKVTILMFHGNAGNIGHRIPIARMFANSMNCNVFMLEYRGYGTSTGSPDQKGLMVDAQTALDHLREGTETKDDRIVVYGQSLGGAVSVQLVGQNQHKNAIKGLILENTFLSMRKLIPSVIPPAKYLAMLCHQLWASDAVLPTITTVPILFLSGLKDEIVPPNHMRQLFEISRSPNKIWKPLPDGDHNSSVLETGYFDAIHDFIDTLSPEGYLEKEK